MEQDHIDRVTEQRVRDQDLRPVPTPKEFERGFIIREYERISRLGKKARPASDVAPTMEREPGPNDDPVRAAPPNDEDLDQHHEEQGRPSELGDLEPDDEPQGHLSSPHTANSAGVVGSYSSLPDNSASDTT